MGSAFRKNDFRSINWEAVIMLQGVVAVLFLIFPIIMEFALALLSFF